MKNLHVLPTDQPSRLQLNINNGKLILFDNFQSENESVHLSNQHIYITSDEEIEEDDWRYDSNHDKVTKGIGESKTYVKNYCSRIILSTDPTLIADGVQEIDNTFLEWFVKNPTCVNVEVLKVNFCARCYSDDVDECWSAKECSDGRYDKIRYKIIIPQEELKQEGYICPHTKIQCDDECCVSAEDCHITSSLASGTVDCDESKQEKKPHSFCETPEEKCTMNYCDDNGCQNRKRKLVEPKQESLEEAAERHYINCIPSDRNSFITGAKWQAERMFSEEDLRETFKQSRQCKIFEKDMPPVYNEFEDWLEKFKKK